MAKPKRKQTPQGEKIWSFIANEQKDGWMLIGSLFFVFIFVSLGVRWALEELARNGIQFSSNPDIEVWAHETVIIVIAVWLSIVWLQFAKKFAIKEQCVKAYEEYFDVTIGDTTERYTYDSLVAVELKERNDRYASFTIQTKDDKVVWKARRQGNLFGESTNADYNAIRKAHKFLLGKLK